MTNLLKSRILLDIAEAFPLFPIPHGQDLVDDVIGDDERSDIRGAFTGKSWNTISSAVLHQDSEALMYFRPHAWAYYLPAFLKESISSDEENDAISNMLVLSMRGRIKEYMALLTPAQEAVMKAFFTWLVNTHPVHQKRREIDAILAQTRQD